MSQTKQMVGTLFAAIFALISWGCTNSAANKAPEFSAATGTHPAGWMDTHYAEYAKNPTQCGTCHGSLTDPAKAGGIAKVSCFTCHPKGPGHPAGWADPTQHGRLGAQAIPSTTAGFANCAKCHGTLFVNGLASTTCLDCHTKAPHPDKPWWTNTLGQPSHVNTDTGNADECAKCHTAGANSTMKPLTTPPVGTPKGCFNETLCHGTNIAR